MWLEALYNEESSILYTIKPSGLVLSRVFECELRKLFVHYKVSYNSKNVRAAAEGDHLY